MTKMCACGKEFDSANKYCSRSCSTTYTNISRGKQSEETKIKRAKSLCEYYGTNFTGIKSHTPTKKSPLISAVKLGIQFTYIQYCTNCGKCFNASVRKNTSLCSDDCYIFTKIHKNALTKRKVIYKDIVFDSSWEVTIAKLLDSLSIKWIRPKESIEWIDGTGKSRKYFPDFYLEEYDVFLDPKNHIVAKKTTDKISYLKENYSNIIIG